MCEKCAKLAQNCTSVQVFVQIRLNFVNFVCVNITVYNNKPTFAADLAKIV